MVGIIDYGVGNLFSLVSSLKFLGIDAKLVSDKKGIDECDRIILPGVGAFGDAAKALSKNGLDQIIKQVASEGKPLLGICLGMQLLFEKGYEFGEHDGLGLIPGSVVSIEPLAQGNKIPHIGWNGLLFTENKSDIYKYVNDGDCVYFVHSFHAECPKE
ncbi:MAG: imidazole glycerol phosphate synthase subunit HisH [Clostridia bacterium]|nr:imidazole glycerol phosphate synthase subunit HisH [Clostridia bacterium]